MKEGLKLAALYGIRPHQLGFCGSQNKRGVLLNYLKNKNVPDKKVREVLKSFKAAYPYLKLIAKSSGIKDPFNERVVRAYWVGNGLLDKVKISDLREMIFEEFSRPGLLPKEIAVEKAQSIPEDSKPHHSFHVLVVGSISGRIVLEGKLKDLCRISWGRVESKIKNQKLKVIYQPLVGNKLGKPLKKIIDWDKDLVPNVKVGDWVSFHWNQAVEVLTDADRENLEKYTKLSLALQI